MRGLPLRFLGPHPFAPLGAVGERLPRGFGPLAALADVVERRRFRLGPGLGGPSEEEVEA